jgi:aspartate aminotransferase
MNNQFSLKSQGISASITLAIDAKAKKMKTDGEDVISFSIGEPDFKTPENIRQAAKMAIEAGLTGYTAASGLPILKEAICEKLKNDNQLEYRPENIVVSNGAKHALFNALQAICNPGDEIIIPIPYWVSYPELVKLADAVPVYVETFEKDDFKCKKESILAAITPKTKGIILNSPNNPTGTVYAEADLQAIMAIAVKYNLYVISDEIYEKLIYQGKHISIASMNRQIKDLTIVVNGMSKCYAMTGWRIGYAACNKEIARIMGNIQSHMTSNPNTIAQYASIEALKGDQTSVGEMAAAFAKRRELMVEKINSIKFLSCRKPNGAFYVMVNISEIIGKKFKNVQINNSFDFADYLLEHAEVAVVPGSGFGADNYIRLSYAVSLEDINKGLAQIAKALD